jgi:hypothetical protein
MTPAERANLEYVYDTLYGLYESGNIRPGEMQQLQDLDAILRPLQEAEAAQYEAETQPMLMARDPSIVERVQDFLAPAMSSLPGMDARGGQRLAGRAAGLLDITPFVGGGMSAGQAVQDARAGDYGSAATNLGFAAMDIVPGVAALRASRGPMKLGLVDFLADESGSVPVPRSLQLPPASNAQKTQIAGTFPTYRKALGLLDAELPEGRTLDFGAGLGMSRDLGFDTYEPFPRAGFDPTYRSASDIPDASYDRLTNLNVLNVVPRDVRDQIVSDIGRVLKPGGVGVVTTRGRDVMSAKGALGPEPMSVITSADTYQKGFSQRELQEYLQSILGDAYGVSPVRLGPAGAMIRRNY